MTAPDLITRQAKSLLEVMREANKTGDVKKLRELESDLMRLQDALDEWNLKRFDFIRHGFDFQASHSKGS